MPINTNKLVSTLQDFVSGIPDIQGAALVTPDGLPLASNVPSGMDDDRIAAMSAAMLSLGERISSELERGMIDRIYIEGNQGYCILTSCGRDAMLLVMASQSAKQGLLMLEIKRVVETLILVLT
ncbi:MAG: roadblock/LC7 domain-containing protein [Cyanobacteria bacterium P01_F01_bin.86]